MWWLMWWLITWFSVAVLVALGLVYDMRRLRVNRVRLPRWGWVLACLGGWPLAVVAYLVCRRKVWRHLVRGVWQLVGDETIPTFLRRQRLLALQHGGLGLVGKPVLDACWRILEESAAAGANDDKPAGS